MATLKMNEIKCDERDSTLAKVFREPLYAEKR